MVTSNTVMYFMARKSVIKIDETVAKNGRRAGLNLRVVSEEAIKEKTNQLSQKND